MAPGSDTTRRIWLLTLGIIAAFCLGAFLVFLVRHFHAKAADPLHSPELAALQQQLLNAPKDEALKTRIRELDQRLRHQYFQHLAFSRTGAWLLLAAAILLVLTGKLATRLYLRPHLPKPPIDAQEQQLRHAQFSRQGVAALALLAALTSLALGLSHRPVLPSQPAEFEKLVAKLTGADTDEPALPTPAELAANWPRFLGPAGNAFAPSCELPETWDVASGAGICWRSPIPAHGFNSPIVWNDRVYLSGDDATRLEVLCYNAIDGTLIWRRPVENVPGAPAQPPEIPESTGFAASTMATDGRRVFAIFANGNIAAFTFDGTPAWSRNLGVPKNEYGHAASLATWQGRLIVQLDQGEASQGRSRLHLLDGLTGRTVWEKTRAVPTSWSTPMTVDLTNSTQIITLGGQWVIAYNAPDGTERWRADLLMGEITPSPVFAQGHLIIVSPSDKTVALRPDGQGDVTKTHIAWTADDNVPDVTSPVTNGELLFTVTTPGTLTCFDLATGKKAWEHELETDIHATPVLAGARLILCGQKGRILIAQAAREYRELARFEMGEPIHATPALAQNRMFVRTTESLFCIGRPATTNATLEVKR